MRGSQQAEDCVEEDAHGPVGTFHCDRCLSRISSIFLVAVASERRGYRTRSVRWWLRLVLTGNLYRGLPRHIVRHRGWCRRHRTLRQTRVAPLWFPRRGWTELRVHCGSHKVLLGRMEVGGLERGEEKSWFSHIKGLRRSRTKPRHLPRSPHGPFLALCCSSNPATGRASSRGRLPQQRYPLS